MVDLIRAAGAKPPLVRAAASRRPLVQAAAGGHASTNPVSENSVLLIVLDDIGSEWFDFMGVGAAHTTDPNFVYAPTPFLSSVAEEGVWFSKASVESTCGPTRIALNTGWYAHRTGGGVNNRDPGSTLGQDYLAFGFSFPAQRVYLAEHIRTIKPAIATGAFGKWHMADGYNFQAAVVNDVPTTPPNANLSDYSKFGYQAFSGNIYNVGCKFNYHKITNGAVSLISGPPFDETTYNASITSTDASAWLAARTGPFFGYVCFGPPHGSHIAPPHTMVSPATAAALTAAGLHAGVQYPGTYTDPSFPLLWRSSMESVDTAIQRCWEAIPLYLRESTYLIVIGDNGTVSNALPTGFVNAKRTLTWGGTRVPLLIKGPRVRNPGREVGHIVHGVDVFKTVCDLLETPVPFTGDELDTAFDSVSMLPYIDDENAAAQRTFVLSQQFTPLGVTVAANWNVASRQRAVFDGRWRLIRGATGDTLYDEFSDPLESVNVAGGNPTEVTRLEALMNSVVPV